MSLETNTPVQRRRISFIGDAVVPRPMRTPGPLQKISESLRHVKVGSDDWHHLGCKGFQRDVLAAA